MKISLIKLSDRELKFHFTQDDAWVIDRFREPLKDLYFPGFFLEGDLSVQRMGDKNVFIHSDFSIEIQRVCGRCLKVKNEILAVSVDRLLSPLWESKRERDLQSKEEAELTAEDLNFSFYRSDEIDVSEILAEQVLLDLPMAYLCQPECKGLCPTCGVNRNEIICACDQEISDTHPFATLKKMKSGLKS